MKKMSIGGSEIGAIVGDDPWRTGADIFKSKYNLTKQRLNSALLWGRYLEPLILEKAARELKLDLTLIGEKFRIDDWRVGKLDAYQLEVKVTSDIMLRKYWGKPETAEVPEWIRDQCIWYMGILKELGQEANRFCIPVLVDNINFKQRIVPPYFKIAAKEKIQELQETAKTLIKLCPLKYYFVDFSKDQSDALIVLGKDFYDNNLMTGIQPGEVTGNQFKIYNSGPIDVSEDSDYQAVLEPLKGIKEEQSKLETREAELREQLKKLLGEHTKARYNRKSIRYGEPAQSQTISYKTAFELIVASLQIPAEMLEDILYQVTETKEAKRTLIVRLK